MHNRNRSQIMSPMKGVGLTNISHIDITRIPVTTGKKAEKCSSATKCEFKIRKIKRNIHAPLVN